MKALARACVLLLCAAVLLQLFFVLRIGLWVYVDPESTTFQRSQAWQLKDQPQGLQWQQQWVAYPHIATSLKRAVIASEDDGFVDHQGVQWQAIERAWQRNQRAQPTGRNRPAKIYGGSTITQQLAKNLLLSGERSMLRKGQELVLTQWLELLLGKQRILEIYLNNVEWGQGVFGAEAAARHYFRKSAAELSNAEAARLAAMLPQPKRFEKMPQSAYLAQRSRVLMQRMPSAKLP